MARLKHAQLEILVVKDDGEGRVSLKGLMKALAGRGIVSMLLEGGPTLNASALQEGVVDRVLFFFAPKVIGGQKAPGIIGGEGILRIKDAEPLRILKIKRMGADVIMEGGLR
jgi:diaminohydroxyphosphoribosylaminopyrimidine deaminase/5-amino-6-(5-phosphoribosylamino)uracil reductase